MTIQAHAVAYVTVPSRPALGSILDIAQVVDGGVPWDGQGMLQSFNCIGVDVNAVDCAQFTGLSKRFDQPSWSDGALFVIQSGASCKPFGFSGADPALTAAFEALEPEGVSTGLYETLLVNGTDITPTGTVTPESALALLEGSGAANYAGAPVIHAGPGLASLWAADRAVQRVGNHLETMLGTPVAVSTGNETKTGGLLDADQWAFVTGSVVLWRGAVSQADQMDVTHNDVVVLYERLYAAAVDCFINKVKVTVY